jgi:hypothetical protein
VVGSSKRREHAQFSSMCFSYDWDGKIIAQFYSTLYVNHSSKTFHWSIQGKPLLVEYASILGFPSEDLLEKIHEKENVLEDGLLHFI